MSPGTYFEWEPLLEKFGNGELPPLEEMESMHSPDDNGYLLRFYQKVSVTWKNRKQQWLNRINRQTEIIQLNNPAEFELIIRDARQSLLPMVKFANLVGFPEHLKSELKTDLDGFIASVREDLIRGIDRQSPHREIFIQCIRTLALPTNNIHQNNQPPATGKRNRSIIF